MFIQQREQKLFGWFASLGIENQAKLPLLAVTLKFDCLLVCSTLFWLYSGGLISKGHPLGATGLAQCAELCWQVSFVSTFLEHPSPPPSLLVPLEGQCFFFCTVLLGTSQSAVKPSFCFGKQHFTGKSCCQATSLYFSYRSGIFPTLYFMIFAEEDQGPAALK